MVLEVWAAPWLIPVQVSRFTFESRDSPKTFLHMGYVFQSIPNITRRSFFNSTLFTIALRREISVHFVCLKYASYLEFQLKLGYNQIKFVWFTFRSKEQNSFNTWVTFSKMSNLNVKPHELLRQKCIKRSKARTEKC